MMAKRRVKLAGYSTEAQTAAEPWVRGYRWGGPKPLACAARKTLA